MTTRAFSLIPLFLAARALAAESASAPASQPAGDWSTPQAAILTFYRAMAEQDSQIAHDSIAWTNEADGKLFLEFAALSPVMAPPPKAMRDFAGKLTAAYPNDEDAAKYAQGVIAAADKVESLRAGALAALADSLQTLDVKIDGDTASVTLKEETQPTTLKKVAGKWLLTPAGTHLEIAPANEIERKQQARALATTKHMVAIRREAFAEFEKDLAAHRFATGKEALARLHEVEAEIARKIMEDPNGTGQL